MLRSVKCKLTSFGHRPCHFTLHQGSSADSNQVRIACTQVLPLRSGYFQSLLFLTSLLGPAQTALAGTFRITPTASVVESYTDNVRSVREGAEADWLTQASAGANFTADGNRLDLNLSLSAVQDYYMDTEGLNGLRPQALGKGNIELLKDHFFIDGSVSLDETSTQRNAEQSAINRSLASNRTQLLLYQVSPRLVNRLGPMLEATLQYNHSESRYSKPAKGASESFLSPAGVLPASTIGSIAGSNQKSDDVSLVLDTRRYFTQLNSTLTLQSSSSTAGSGASGRNAVITGSRADSGKFKEKRIDLANEYQLTRQFALTARAGYEDVNNRNSDTAVRDTSLSSTGATGALGFHYRPGPRLDLRSEFGRKFGDKNLLVDLSYKISTFYVLNASFTQSVETQTGSRLNQLNRLIVGPDGNLIDPFTGRARNPADSNFDLSNNTFREDLFQLGLNGTHGRNSYSLGVDLSNRESLGNSVKEEELEVNLDFKRRLQPRLSGNVSLSYTDQLSGRGESTNSRGVGGGDKQYQSDASLNYQLGPSLSTNLRYSYMKDKFKTLGDITENVIAASIQANF